MKLIKLCLLLVVALTLTNCFEDGDDNAIATSEINDFVWKAMNAMYLYKADVDDLANNRFSDDETYSNFLNGFSTPESLFYSLTYDPSDRFSYITSNYINFLQSQEGTTRTAGVEFNFELKQGSETDGYLVVRLVLHDSEADIQGVQRGQIVDAINNIPITNSNVNDLVNQTTFTLNFANYNDNGTPNIVTDDTIESTTNSVTLTKELYTENPIFQTNIIDVDGENVGYLVYNRFNNSYDNELNAAFGQFQANNVQHLILDLRYNPGGSVNTASLLGSMVTGQHNGEIFSKLIYNADLQENNSNYKFVNSFDGNAINSLGLEKVYILTTEDSASASELVINSLKEYITVIQIGDYTTGKTQASITLFDSPNFGPNDINPNHTYALQPLVANSVNVNDGEVPAEGIQPYLQLEETPNNYGVLGDINEPLLAAAISDIQGLGRFSQSEPEYNIPKKDINLSPFEDRMYIDIDDISINRLQFD